MKRVISSAMMLICGVMMALAQNPAQIKFEKTTHNFGTFSEANPVVTCEFNFTNVGEQPLVINQAIASKEGGKEIPVAEKTYILFCRNRIVPALKREVLDIPGLDKKKAKAFFKEHKIKWSRPESLTEVADFLTENLF